MEYLLKASAVILIFYACYKLFLQRETFFESNRWFLIIGIITAVSIPFIVIPVYIEYVPVIQNFIVANDGATIQTAIKDAFNFKQLFYLIYSLGALFFLVKLMVEFSSLFLLLKKNTTYKKGGYSYIETNQKISPFSFFKYIVYNNNQFNHAELELIINHEKIHAKHYHSLDILLIQIASALFWFNPIIWLYKKEMQQNLEFIADKEAQTVSNCEKSYQTLLLKSSVPNYHLVLANNFYNSLIKKRIVMLQKSKSNKLNVWKYALVLPVLGIFLMSANTKKIYVEKAIATESNAALADPSIENELNSILYSSIDNENHSTTSNDALKTSPKSEQLNQANSIKSQDPKAAKATLDHEMVMITKDFSDADFESLKNRLNEKGITVKFKGIKRNNENEITAIKIDVSSKTSNANYHTDSDDPIQPIKIGIDSDGSKISIGNSNVAHVPDHSYSFVSKDGNHKIHTVGSADNVVVIAGDDIEEDGQTIVTRKVGKVHFSPKAKGKAKFISENGKVTEIEDENTVIWESQNGDVDTIHVKKMGKSNAVWINKTDKAEIYEFDHGDANKIIIKTDSGKAPLYFINGKEISKEEMDAIKSDSIEKVEVLKGDSATEKYGEKGKNGVVLITTKDKE